MTQAPAPSELASAQASAAPATRRRRSRLWLILAAVLVCAAALTGWLLYVHWRDNAREFDPYLGIDGTYSRGRVGVTVYTDAGVQPDNAKAGHEVLDLRRLTPRVTTNTANATVELLICKRNSAGGLGGALSTKPFCATANKFKPGQLDLGFTVAQVIYAITARRPGEVRIDGCDVSYHIGNRSGNQHVGSGFIFTVPKAPK